MFKHCFVCSNKEFILNKIEGMMMRDRPEKSIWGLNLYRSGIHFQECGEIIKGFYLSEGEDESVRGSPIRVCFTGRFIECAGNLYFKVFIYPRLFEAMLLLFAFASTCAYGDVVGLIFVSFVSLVFIKGYYDMMNDTYRTLDKIFK